MGVSNKRLSIQITDSSINILISNLNVGSSIKLIELVDSGVFSKYEGKIYYLQDDIMINTLLAISTDQDAINKIIIENKKIVEWIGENPYKKSND